MIKKYHNYINENKLYKNINNFVDGEKIDYYNVPFDLMESGKCFDKDGYVLCLSDNFVYDYIKDSDIDKNLDDDLSNIDISKDWTSIKPDEKFNFETAFSDKKKHIKRVAKLVNEIRNGEKLTPVLMYFDDRSYMYDIKNYIEDGNHRIRALQYLKYDYFPAYIHGNFSDLLIDYIK